MSVLIDGDLLFDYLMGDIRARNALDPFSHRAICVVTWLELMAKCPTGLEEPTRSFLRSFERLGINEAIADEALRLTHLHRDLSQSKALTWATARVNQLRLVTADPSSAYDTDETVFRPY